MPFDDVEIIVNDTAAVPWGLDTYGSRSLVVGGTAIRHAAEGLVEKAKQLAAHLLEADPGDIEFDAGTFRVKGTPDGHQDHPGAGVRVVRRALHAGRTARRSCRPTT